jgi:hypothetical protein
MTTLGSRLPTQVRVRSAQPGAARGLGGSAAKKAEIGGDRAILDGEDDGRRALRRVLAGEEREAEEREPLSLPAGHRSGWTPFAGDAFPPEGPRPIDVDQGNLQDAWLLASCAAVAAARPEALVERVIRGEGGSFWVRLGDHPVEVEPSFPSERCADPSPAGTRDRLWVALLEKAFAIEAGGYAELEGGNPGRALERLTGGAAARISVTDTRPVDDWWDRLEAAARAHRPIVLRTRGGDVAPPLAADHDYAVLVLQDRSVQLYNPWGTKRGSRPLEAVVVRLGVEALRAGAEAFYLGG